MKKDRTIPLDVRIMLLGLTVVIIVFVSLALSGNGYKRELETMREKQARTNEIQAKIDKNNEEIDAIASKMKTISLNVLETFEDIMGETPTEEEELKIRSAIRKSFGTRPDMLLIENMQLEKIK